MTEPVTVWAVETQSSFWGPRPAPGVWELFALASTQEKAGALASICHDHGLRTRVRTVEVR